MSEYEKASRGAYMLFLSQIIGIFGTLISISIIFGYSMSALSKTAFYLNNSISPSSFIYTTPAVSGMELKVLSFLINALILAVIVGGIIEVVQFLFNVYGWKELSKFNRSEYRTPYIGSILSLIGLILAIPSIAFILSAVKPLLASISSGASPPAQALAVLAVGSVPVLLGSLLIIVGYIIVLVGYWRLGSNFNSSLIKAAVILIIVGIVLSLVQPLIGELLGVVSLILLTAGLYSVSKKAKALSASPSQ